MNVNYMVENDNHFSEARERMVEEQIMRRGVRDKRVLDAMRRVERHAFVLQQDRGTAYEDYPLPIGQGQTISQPYIVAYMIEQLKLTPADRVLEIGTGSGYSAAIMAELCEKVFTLEIVKDLYELSSQLLKKLNYKNIICLLRDGYQGLPEEAPFDKIVLTAAPMKIPTPLLDQLKVGGRLIAPIGSIRFMQRLSLFEKLGPQNYKESELMGVSFVEMVHDDALL